MTTAEHPDDAGRVAFEEEYAVMPNTTALTMEEHYGRVHIHQEDDGGDSSDMIIERSLVGRCIALLGQFLP